MIKKSVDKAGGFCSDALRQPMTQVPFDQSPARAHTSAQHQHKFRALAAQLPSGGLLAIFCVATFGQVRAMGVEFQVSGQIEQRSYTGVRGIETDAFEVFVRDDDWLIKIHQLSFPSVYTNVMLLDYVCFNKGDSIYTFARARDEKGIVAKLLADPKVPDSWKLHPERMAVDMAWIDKSRVPHADMRFSLPTVFYAYCSQKYLDEADDTLLEPPFFVDARVNSFGEGVTNVPVYCKRNRKLPFLPEQISFMHWDRKLIGPGMTVALNKEWESFTNALFNVDEFTNVENLMLPSSFSFTLFSDSQSNGREPFNVTTSVRLIGHVKAALNLCDVDSQGMKPSMPAYANVTDNRLFDDGHALRVRYHTNEWLTEEEVVQLPQYKVALAEFHKLRQAALEHQRTMNNRTVRFYVVAFLLCTTVLFVYFAFKNIKQTTK